MKNYKKPDIERIEVDNEISLILQSTPPLDPPFGAPSGLPGGF